MKKSTNFIFVFLLFSFSILRSVDVALCIVATNKYTKFVGPLVESARKFFLKGHNVKFFIFTDTKFLMEGNDINVLYWPHMPWPLSTMYRCAAYLNHKECFEGVDYLFACDADMLFISTVGDEILGDTVGTRHPLLWNNEEVARTQFEHNIRSHACIDNPEYSTYYAGGFYGGKRENFININATIVEWIHKDLSINIIPQWHDESYLNKYFYINSPQVSLDSSYCSAEVAPDLSLMPWYVNPENKKLLALDKNKKEVREHHA